jgi:glycerol-3-phosphate dehydrogenase
LPLAGGDCSREELRDLESHLGERYPEIPPATIARVVAKYGTQSETLLDPIADSPDFAEPVATGTALLRAEIRYAIEHEMALTVEDVLDRRTQLLLFSLDQGLGAVDGVAEMLAERLGWNSARTESETATYRVLAESLLPGRIKQEPAKTGRTARSKAATRSRSTR